MEESAKTELKSKYEKMTGEDLRRENKRLKAQLDKINMRVTSYYEKSLIKINNKTTNGRLSHDLNISQLVFQSEMKNSENYKQYLGREKVKLESILTKSVNRRQKNVEEEIREEKTKMKSIKKENKENQLNIMKNGSTLTTNKITTCE